MTWLEQGGRKKDLCKLSRNLTDAFDLFFQKKSDKYLGRIFKTNKRHNDFFSSSPQFPAICKQLEKVPACHKTFTYKPTGAGGEDALIVFGDGEGLGAADEVLSVMGWHKLPVAFRERGLELEVQT